MPAVIHIVLYHINYWCLIWLSVFSKIRKPDSYFRTCRYTTSVIILCSAFCESVFASDVNRVSKSRGLFFEQIVYETIVRPDNVFEKNYFYLDITWIKAARLKHWNITYILVLYRSRNTVSSSIISWDQLSTIIYSRYLYTRLISINHARYWRDDWRGPGGPWGG